MEHKNLKEYSGGWMTERKGTEVPAFLKLAFPVIAFGCLGYLLIYMNGEVNHPDRGPLVQQMNAATEASGLLMYAVAAMVVIFGIVVVAFSLRKFHE